MARKTRQVETRLIAEYLKETYSSFPFITCQPLGEVSPALMASEGYERALGLTRPFRPVADALVILPRYLVLIEAKVWQVMIGLGKLPLYRSLVAITPELKQYMPREIILELVVGWTNSNLEKMASDNGVRVKVFCPPWLSEIVAGMHKYWTPEYRATRDEKLRMRELLGLE